MKSIYGITNICVKKIEMNFRDKEPTKELNKFLQENNGNIIDIQYIGELYGIDDAIVTYKEDK